MSDGNTSAGGMTTTVGIMVNGDAVETQAETLAALLEGLGYADQSVATAVDGDFVAADARRFFRLYNGAKIEIVAPRQGG